MAQFRFDVIPYGAGSRLECRWRLHYGPSTLHLYAQSGFDTPADAQPSDVLEQLIAQARRNDSGVNHMQVEPFTMLLVGCVNPDEAAEMFQKACLVAGHKATRS